METSTKKRLSATVTYLLCGLLVACVCLAVTGTTLSQWAKGDWWSVNTVGVLHGLLLGFLLTVAYGVLYQVVPIAFQAPPMPRHVLYWHLPLHILSVLALIAGFVSREQSLSRIGGIGVLIGLLGFAHFLYHVSYKHARNRTPVHRMLGIPIASLGATILLGLFQLWQPAHIGLPLLLTHAILGGILFWGGLVLVVSYKFVPMFVLSHGYQASLPRAGLFYFLGGGLLAVTQFFQYLDPVLSTSVWLYWLRVLSALAVLVGMGFFAWDVTSIVKSRKRKRIVFPLKVALAALGLMLISEALMVFCAIHTSRVLLVLAAYLFLFAGLIPLVFSYMQKIIPFLWFEYRFSKRPERRSAPLIDDMVPPRRVRVALVLYGIGVLVGGLEVVHFFPADWAVPVSWMSAFFTTVGALTLFTALSHVLTIGGPRPVDDVPR
ncbi:MAG: hypothetical protein K6T63_02445 [Alicyclobacillus herbarius]|uniref:hypothetical protein n=1 Tax=Alicyclobacillus herbarius TaxID=122960 RepID=UPI0023563D90|nr:hypothetical protein [Alicyclobacillus herbarius]MCL6631467.1 hypothetical protein [Alicyclobacillus herbarius]